MRFLGAAIVSVGVFAIAIAASAQSVPSSQTQIAPDKNPIIPEVKRLTPSILPTVLEQLRKLVNSRREGGLRGSDPTPGESAQIAANAAFAAAYNNDPVRTLMLLRWINRNLRGSGEE